MEDLGGHLQKMSVPESRRKSNWCTNVPARYVSHVELGEDREGTVEERCVITHFADLARSVAWLKVLAPNRREQHILMPLLFPRPAQRTQSMPLSRQHSR